ncbi:hypothetical protein [Bacilliculturomica massiliensis]|uniref:hypothetical protein n=1 Tax=Bacilliculturomica massiliensis TaxID=1917867 RepID=UPI0010327612|nr:hypothetical protein [Bacilliculturomica massiliensis]
MGMNELKKSTYMALIGVVVAAVALATATYAWFVNNQKTEVERVTFSSEAASDLLIAVHNGTATEDDQTGLSYKSFLSNEDVKAYTDLVEEGLRGVSTVSAAAFYTNEGMSGEGGGPDTNGFDVTNKAEFFRKVEDGSGMYLALPIWFRSSTDVDVYLRGGNVTTSGTAVTAASLPESPKGSMLTRAVMIGFRPKADGAPVLYEPDPAEEGGNYTRRNTTRVEGVEVPDKYGIASLKNDGKIAAIQPQDRKSSERLFLVTDELIRFTKEQLDAMGGARPQPLFRLNAGVPELVTVYVWLDGMDYDCISDISGGLLSVKLAFIAGETE